MPFDAIVQGLNSGYWIASVVSNALEISKVGLKAV